MSSNPLCPLGGGSGEVIGQMEVILPKFVFVGADIFVYQMLLMEKV